MTDVRGDSGRTAPGVGALAGSLVVAGVFGAIRAATIHLWMENGQPWRKGNWLTGLLWVVSFAAHFGVDYLVDPRGPNGGQAGSLTGSA